MYSPVYKALNTIIPIGIRTIMISMARRVIPSLRHLHMPTRLRHMAWLGYAPRVIYDIGAATGTWSRLAYSIWPDAQIIAFEPNKSNSASLETVRKMIRKFDYVMVFLGNKNEEVSYVDRGAQTTLLDINDPSCPRMLSHVRRLDDLMIERKIPHPDLIKIDVQGYELEVLKGGDRALSSASAVLLEVNFTRESPEIPLVGDVISYMNQMGFIPWDLMGILRQPETDILWQADIMFVRDIYVYAWSKTWASATNAAPKSVRPFSPSAAS